MDDIISSIGIRVKALRNELDLSQADFGKKLGVKRDVINNLERGRNKTLNKPLLKAIITVFNVNEDWLKTGDGNMFNETKVFSFDKFLQEREATELEIDIMKIYMSLDKNIRKKLMSDLKKAVLKDNELSITNENSETEEEAKEILIEHSNDVTVDEITKQIVMLENLLEKKQMEKSSASQKDDCGKMA